MKAVDLDVGGESAAANEDVLPFHVILAEAKTAAAHSVLWALLTGFAAGVGLTVAVVAVALYH